MDPATNSKNANLNFHEFFEQLVKNLEMSGYVVSTSLRHQKWNDREGSESNLHPSLYHISLTNFIPFQIRLLRKFLNFHHQQQT